MGKLKDLGSSEKLKMIDESESKTISLVKQCALLNINRSSLYYEPLCLAQPNIAHPKHSYKLRGLDIVRANQVWSTDITYIKIAGGMVYLAAVIDWYSKAVQSWRISNTMDTALVVDVLNEALLKYGKPEIFNTDQGSQYTSYIHTAVSLRGNALGGANTQKQKHYYFYGW